MSSSSTPRPTRLRHLSTILVGGPDATMFLQGQLSADVGALGARELLLAPCNSAQGRVQAVLWLVQRTDGSALLLPADSVEAITARLRRYVLRAKVSIRPAPPELAPGLFDADAARPAVLERPGHYEHEGRSYIRLPGHAAVLCLSAQTLAEPRAESDWRWRLEDIQAGLPQVYPPTHEASSHRC